MDMTPESGLRFPKHTPRCVEKKRREKLDAKNERACREIVRARDKGKCRVPGCKDASAHLHHIVYRSRSKALKHNPDNLVSLCVEHHRLIHAGVIAMHRESDGELVITGDVNRLKFRL